MQSFTPLGNSVPLAQRFVKAYDVQVLIWGITGVKFHLVIALCIVVRALGQLYRKCLGALVGQVALVLVIYEVVAWAAWNRFIRDTYMPGVDFVTPVGEILLGLVLLILLANDLGLLIATVVRFVKGGSTPLVDSGV